MGNGDYDDDDDDEDDDDDDDDDDSALRSVCRPRACKIQSTKRNDPQTLFTNQCQKLTQGSQAQLSVFFFPSHLFQFCPPCFGFSFLHASKPVSSSFRRLFRVLFALMCVRG